jgi:N-methylhydantoinase B
VRGPLNSPLSKAWTTVFYCVRCVLPDDIPFNDGLTRVVEVYVPEGTLLNPRHPAPVNARSVTVNRVADTVMGALALAVPAKVGAQCCGVPVGVSFGGMDPRTGRNFVFYESYNGGMGGSLTADGADAVSTGTSNAMNIPVESIEMDYPVRVSRYELVPDSGGSGKFRGGLGICANTKCSPKPRRSTCAATARHSRRAACTTAATAASARSISKKTAARAKRFRANSAAASSAASTSPS